MCANIAGEGIAGRQASSIDWISAKLESGVTGRIDTPPESR